MGLSAQRGESPRNYNSSAWIAFRSMSCRVQARHFGFMSLSVCGRVVSLLLAAVVVCVRPQAATTQGSPQGSPTQSSTLHPQGENKTLGPDLRLDSVPKGIVSVRFVVCHRSALNGRIVRVRGVVAAAFLGKAACPPDRGMCIQPSIILADSEPSKGQLPDSIRIFVLASEKQQNYPIGKLLEVRGVVHGSETAVQLTQVAHSTPP